MINRRKKITFIFAAMSAVMLSGCKEDVPQATEANLEVARVQGVRFDEPLTATNMEAAASIEQTPGPVSFPDENVALDPLNAPLPTAADVPEDIAMIPSATPAISTPAADAAPEEPETVAIALPSDPDAFAPISFKTLSSYKYVEPVPAEGERPEDVEARRQSDQIPAEVKSLDGRKAVLEGWMVPMEVSEDGSVKSFILVNTQPQCCFGDMQAMNEWVDVMMTPGSNADFNVDTPVKVYGQLEVGEKTEDGFVLSLYRMKANRVDL